MNAPPPISYASPTLPKTQSWILPLILLFLALIPPIAILAEIFGVFRKIAHPLVAFTIFSPFTLLLASALAYSCRHEPLKLAVCIIAATLALATFIPFAIALDRGLIL